MKSTAVVLAAIVSASSAQAEPPGRPPAKPESARIAVLSKWFMRMGDRPFCLGVDPGVNQSGVPADTRTLDAVAATLKVAERSDPAQELVVALPGNIHPISTCGRGSERETLQRVLVGPVQLISPIRAQLLVYRTQGGFPEVAVCMATLRRNAWRSSGCTMVLEGP
jgi:hypothetical protein